MISKEEIERKSIRVGEQERVSFLSFFFNLFRTLAKINLEKNRILEPYSFLLRLVINLAKNLFLFKNKESTFETW